MDSFDSSLGVPLAGTPENLLRICDQSLGQLGTVDDEVGFFGDNGDGTGVFELAEGLNKTDSTASTVKVQSCPAINDNMLFLPSNNNNLLLRIRDGALHDRTPLSSLDIRLRSSDIHRTIFLKDVERVQRVQSGSIFHISSGDIEASYTQLARLSLNDFPI